MSTDKEEQELSAEVKEALKPLDLDKEDSKEEDQQEEILEEPVFEEGADSQEDIPEGQESSYGI